MSKPLLAVFLAGAAACGDGGSDPSPDAGVALAVAEAPALPPVAKCKPKQLAADPAWFGTNRTDLMAWLATAGCASPGYSPAHKPVALFDWDNTISKQDFGDAFTFFLIAHDKVLQPAGYDWKQTSRFMTDAGAAALAAACGTDVAPGQPLPTSTNLGCADEMLSMYVDNVTRGGATAFAGHNFRRM